MANAPAAAESPPCIKRRRPGSRTETSFTTAFRFRLLSFMQSSSTGARAWLYCFPSAAAFFEHGFDFFLRLINWKTMRQSRHRVIKTQRAFIDLESPVG